MLDRYHSEKTGTNYENQSATVFIIPNHGSEVLNRRDQRVFFFSSKWLGIFYRSRQRKKKPSGTQGNPGFVNGLKNQTFSKYSGNSQKINSAHILRLARLKCETNHDILRLAEYQFIYEKIDNNRIASKCRFWCSKFKKNLEASRHKMKHSRPIKAIKS